MALDLRSTSLDLPLRRLSPAPPLRHSRLVAVLGPAALSLAVLVGRDGSPPWRLARVVTVAAVATVAMAALQRLSERWCGRVAIAGGTVGLVCGIGFLPYLVKGGSLVTSLAAVVATGAGLALVGAGAVLTGRGKGRARRTAAKLCTVLGVAVAAWTLAPSIIATNVPRPTIGASPASKGLPFEAVNLRAADGVRLAAWYVQSANGAAVILRHGAGSTRSNVLDHTAVLARHGFGVLLMDARGHGESSGRAMDFGWHGNADIEAATRFLVARADVDPARIGAVGMSMGGEELIGATASNPTIRAVVAEGATTRSARDEDWYSDEYGWRGAVQEQLERAQDVLTNLLTSASVPISNRAAVQASPGTEYLLITAGKVAEERHATDYVAAGAPDRVETWTVEGAGHTDGLRTDPVQWERRVIQFLSETLLNR